MNLDLKDWGDIAIHCAICAALGMLAGLADSAVGVWPVVVAGFFLWELRQRFVKGQPWHHTLTGGQVLMEWALPSLAVYPLFAFGPSLALA